LLGQISGNKPGATPSKRLIDMLIKRKDTHKSRDWLLLQWMCLQEEFCRVYLDTLDVDTEASAVGLMLWLKQHPYDATFTHVRDLVLVMQHLELFHQVCSSLRW
jgi:hypothetical protein